MKRERLNQPNFTIFRERDSSAQLRMALLLLSGLLLAGGFVFAAGQHFTAVSYGYEGEKLRLAKEYLVEEQRRLLLAREEASAPSRLESEAIKLGLQPVGPGQVGVSNGSQKKLPQTAVAMAAPPTSLSR
jgi:cell division protein FtsL